MNTENYCQEYIPTRLEKLGWRLFPSNHCDIPDKIGMHDCVVTITRSELSFMDRLRVLVSGRIEVQSKTATENLVGSHATNAVLIVRPPYWLDR